MKLTNVIVIREPYISVKWFLDKAFEVLRVFHINMFVVNDTQRKAKLTVINLHYEWYEGIEIQGW